MVEPVSNDIDTSISRTESRENFNENNINPSNPETLDVSRASSTSNSPIKIHKRLTIRDFEIISELGEGAYAKVVLAKYIIANKKVAIKILNKNFIDKINKSHEALIEREILKILDHPNVIKLISTFHDKEKLYFVLEYAPNRDLASFIRSYGKLSFELAKFYAAQLVNAISYLHELNIAHRDLKPENLMLDANMHIKIIDFSTAAINGKYFDKHTMKFESIQENKIIQKKDSVDSEEFSNNNIKIHPNKESLDYSEVLRRSSLVGTAEYVSPEMLKKTVISHLTTDIWALGCIIYKFFHGRTPFKGDGQMDVFRNILNMKFNISNDIPESAQDIIRKILIETPHDRLGAGLKGSDNDIAALKQHEFFKGIDFNELINNKSPLKVACDRIKQHDSNESFKLSENGDFFVSLNNILTNDGCISPIKRVIRPIKHIKSAGNILEENHISISEFIGCECYVDLNNNDIIEDYIKIEDLKNYELNNQIVKEGIIKKKAWLVFYTIKLKLFADGRLELWNLDKNILMIQFKLNCRSKLRKIEKCIFEIIQENKSHRFKTTENEADKWVTNIRQYIK